MAFLLYRELAQIKNGANGDASDSLTLELQDDALELSWRCASTVIAMRSNSSETLCAKIWVPVPEL